MKKSMHILAGALGFITFVAPLAFANAASLSVQSLTPGGTVPAKDKVTFSIIATGFSSPMYQLTDSFPGSTAHTDNISVGGNFFWVPIVSDAGTHTFTITANDSSGVTASVTQTIVVAPPPSIAIQAVLPGPVVLPGVKYSFVVAPSGLANPTYSVGDSMSGSSVANVKIDSSGVFFWTPEIADNGDHTITVYASDGSGHSATASQSVRVGVGPKLTIALITPGTTVPFGTTTSFTVIPTNFSPTAFGVSDSFPGSSISNININTSGLFYWVPRESDAGVHTLTIKGTVGAFGDSTTTTQVITVLGANGALPATLSAPTAASSTSLSALQAQLAALMAQSASITAAPAATPPASRGSTFTSYLRPKSQGDEVLELQKILHQLGFLTDEPSGTYGAHTVDAVMKFQKAHKLAQLGVVGPATRVALNALQQEATPTTISAPTSGAVGNGYVFKNFMGLGEDVTDGPDVKELQKRLISLGYMKGDASGFFGPATATAVKKFQKANGIEATGFVGVATRTALNK